MDDHSGARADLRDLRNQYYVAACSLVWAMSFAAATWVLDRTPVSGVAAWAVAIGPSLIGLVALAAFLRYLRHSDELIQKINLQALALAFAVGVLLTMGYSLLELAGAPRLGGQVLGGVMLLVYSFAQLYGNLRYR